MRAHKLLGLSAVLLCVAAAPAPQANSQVASNDAQPVATNAGGGGEAQAQPPAEKKICKALPSSGTRFTKKACLTDKEWKQVEADREE